MAASQTKPSVGGAFMVGDWLVEPNLNRLSRETGDEAFLKPKAMEVLVHLAEQAAEVVSADTLIEVIWEGRPMGDNPVYKCITQLRKAFGDRRRDPAYIATVSKRGYRLIAPVTPITAEPAVPEAEELTAEPEEPPDRPLPESSGDDLPSAAPRRTRMTGMIAVMAVLVILAGVSGLWLGGLWSTPGDDGAPSLAVMPFTASPGLDSNFRINGDGVAEEVSYQLSKAPGLRVISHESATNLKGMEVAKATRLLGVNHLLVGNLHSEYGEIMIEGGLVSADGEVVWRYAVSGRESDFFNLVDEITQGASGYFGVSFDPDWVSACAGTRDIDACQRYKLAIEHFRNQGENYKTRAIRLLEEAVTLDPGFAAAHAATATAYVMRGDEVPWAESVERADIAIRRAMELGPDLPETHLAHAFILVTDRVGPCPPLCRNFDGYVEAEHYLRKALEARPDYPIAHTLLGATLYGQGRLREAAAHFQTALLYDPLSPAANYFVALDKALGGDLEAARQHVTDFIERYPGVPPYMYTLAARIEAFYGRFDKSLELFRRRVEHPAAYPWPLEFLADTYYDLGLFEQLEVLLQNSRRNGDFDLLYAAAYRKLLSAQGRIDDLEALSTELKGQAGRKYGSMDDWPRWLHRSMGHNLYELGDYEGAVFHLERVFGADGRHLDHQWLVGEMDALHAYAYSLGKVGETARSEAIVEHSLEVMRSREREGYSGLPDLTAARARAFAMQGKTALSVATMRQAVAQGWRRYWSIVPGDPCWSHVFDEPDFKLIMAGVLDEVNEMRNQADPYLVRKANSSFFP